MFNLGNIPLCLKSFMTGVFSGENEQADVFDCTYDEIIKKATIEKLEPQVIIDKKNTGRAYLCAVGASVRTVFLYEDQQTVKPIFYYAELDEPRKRQFQVSLREARAKLINDHRMKLAVDQALKEEARLAGDKLRNGQSKSNK